MSSGHFADPTCARTETVCYIGVGSNLNDPLGQARCAMRALSQLDNARLQKASSLYQSDPLGPADQPRYINAVVELCTCLSPLALLDVLQGLENEQGRERTTRWGARTLDLDLLLYGDQIIQVDRLTVPHPAMTTRSFVLLPLLELSPDIVIPGAGLARECLLNVPSLGIEKLVPE